MISNFFKNKWNIFFLLLLFCSVTLEITFRFSSDFSEFFCIFISQTIRKIYKPLTVFPFAISESLVIIAVLTVILTVILILVKLVSLLIKKTFNAHLKSIFKCFFRVAVVIMFLFSTTFSSAYHRKPIRTLMNLENVQVTRDSLEMATSFVADRLYEISKYISYTPNYMTTSGMDFHEISAEVEKATNRASEIYTFLHKSGVKAKPLALSVPMTYTHISGIYTFFTGEPCVNTNYSHYTLPFTTAHEYAHQRGIGHENEADFMAFLILIQSNNAYLHYSAWMNVYTVLSNELYEVDREAALEISSTLPEVAKNDYRMSAKALSKYSDSKVGDIARDINDTYLKANGVEEGVHSYSESVKLIVSFLSKYY